MSINRLFLRCAAVAALSPFEDEAGPTFAGPHVYDSRLESIQYDEGNSELPLIAVYTDDDDAEQINPQEIGGPANRTVVLRIEFVIGSFQMVRTDRSGEEDVEYVVPVIDAQMEAKLDMFEQQIKWLLTGTGWRPGTQAFLKLVKRIRLIRSMAERSEDGNHRLAARRLLIHLDMVDDCRPMIGLGAPASIQKTPLDFGAFPGAPWLGEMLKVMSQQPSVLPVIEALSDTRIAAVYLPVLKRIGVTVDAIEPADSNLLEEQGKTRGPDGRVDHQATWRLPDADD